MHPTDQHAFQRMLSVDVAPESVEDEYELWLNMYHRDGNSGPLGSIGMIAMLRSLGMVPPPMTKGSSPQDWAGVKPGMRVEALFTGYWRPGAFEGRAQFGKLAIKLDEQEDVIECSAHMVRKPPKGPASVKEADWTEISRGTSCEVEWDGEHVSATFERALDGGLAIVLVNSEERTVSVDSIELKE